MENYFNKLEMKLLAKSENEAFARSSVASFVLALNPTLEEINDIKTAVSEAVTNCIVHAYKGLNNQTILISVGLDNNKVEIIIQDSGAGIEDVETALQPFFTTKPEEERSGMGFTLMKTFMDDVIVTSKVNEGTKVTMFKTIKED
ncbi:MAG: anti-sigma F factor [Clostridia bacterium]